MPRPVVLVVDTGVDDALALVVAARHPHLDLRAVVATGGNTGLGRVLANTAHVLGLLECAVPIAAGPAVRRDGTAFPPRLGHGPDGLAGAGPPLPLDPESLPSPGGVLAPGAVLVSLGPLTAVADLVAPEAGAAPVAAGAPVPVLAACARPGEANHAMDPSAAADVERSGVRLAHDGGEAFSAPGVPAGVAEAMARSADPVTALAGTLLLHQSGRGAGLGDAGVVLRLAEPGIAADDAAARLVELAGG